MKSTVNGMFYLPPDMDPELRKLLEEMHRRILNLEIDAKEADAAQRDFQNQTKRVLKAAGIHWY